MAVLLTPPKLQFLDNSGNPLAFGKVYTYAATGGTFSTPKPTYTTQAGDVANANPVVLDAAGRANIWITGSYDFKITDSADVELYTQLAVTAFSANAPAGGAYFESLSGNGSQTAFTVSQNLGTDEKAIYVWVDAGGTKGYDIKAPSEYIINGTSLTFTVAPPSGTNNIYVSAPSLLVNAASSAAAAAEASAAAALASQTAASTSAAAALASQTAASTSATAAATSEAAALTSKNLAQQWASKTDGIVDGTDYSAKAWAVGGLGTTTNSAKYWAEQAAAATLGDVWTPAQQSLTPATPPAGYWKVYTKSEGLFTLDDEGIETRVGPGATNLLLNPDGLIAQTGSTFNGIANNSYALDQANILSDGNGVFNVSRDLTSMSEGSPCSFKFEIATANKKGGYVQFLENIESAKIINAIASFSFQAKKNAGNATLNRLRAAIISWTGTADVLNTNIVSAWNGAGVNPTLAANWTYEGTVQEFILTNDFQLCKIENVEIDTAATKNVAVFIWVDNVDATAGDVFNIAQLKLEKSAFSTAYYARNNALEFLLCSRFFWRLGGSSANPGIGTAVRIFNTQSNLGIFFPRPMRIIPSITLSAAGDIFFYSNASTCTSTGIAGADVSNDAALIAFSHTSSVISTNDSCLGVKFLNSGYLDFNARL